MNKKITALLEVLREYIADGGSEDVYKEASSQLINLIPHEQNCSFLIRERDDAGRFTKYACNCKRRNAIKKIAKAGQG